MVEIVNYNAKEHYGTILQWFIKRNLGVMPEDCLPPTGFIARNDSELIAAVFIYQTNSAICYMENFISNPEIDKAMADSALDQVVLSGLEFAKKQGFRLVIGGTKLKAVANRAQKLGFRLDEDYFFYTYFKIGA